MSEPTTLNPPATARLARAARLLAGAVGWMLLVGWAHAETVTIDETNGAAYDAILDGFPGLALLDGEPDFGENALAASLKANVTEQRAVAEFPLPAAASADSLQSAVLVFNIDDVLTTFGPGTDFNGRAASRFFIHVYSGDGEVVLADFKHVAGAPHQVDTTTFGAITDATLRQTGPRVFSVDVTQDVRALAGDGATHVGLVWRVEDSPTGTSIDDLGDGSSGPPGVNGSRMPSLILEVGSPASPTPTGTPTVPLAPSSTSTRNSTPTGTSTRTPRDTATAVPPTVTSTPRPTAALGSPTPTVPFIRGDANCDGVVDNEDFAVLQRLLFDTGATTSCPQADVNDDGTASAADLPALLNLNAAAVRRE